MASRMQETPFVDTPDRAMNFFENTELAYMNTAERLSAFANRIDEMSNSVAGHEATTEDGKANLSEKPSSYFDRCNLAERNLSIMVDQLDQAIARLESLGLF